MDGLLEDETRYVDAAEVSVCDLPVCCDLVGKWSRSCTDARLQYREDQAAGFVVIEGAGRANSGC